MGQRDLIRKRRGVNQSNLIILRLAPSPLCVEMGFYTDISWDSRCNIDINVWAHIYKILLVFEVPWRPGTVHVVQPKGPIDQFKPVHQSLLSYYIKAVARSKKQGGGHYLPPGSDRVNWSAKNLWGGEGRAPPCPLVFMQPFPEFVRPINLILLRTFFEED